MNAAEPGDPELTPLEELRIGIWSHGIGEHVAAPLGRPATIHDLWLTKFKAEIVNDELILIGPTAPGSASAASNIRTGLHRYEEAGGAGYVFPFRTAFVVDLPHRRSFCPDVSGYVGEPGTSRCVAGAPVFAVEICDPSEYGHEMEARMAAKRADYFAAGTQVVWDVDALRENVIRAYHADDPEHPVVFARGEVADAEPAVPGWRFAVDEMFD